MTADRKLEMLNDVRVRVAVEVGACAMPIAQILALGTGSLVQLDRAAGTAVDMLVNGKLIGRGEIVAIDENYGLRVTELVAESEPA